VANGLARALLRILQLWRLYGAMDVIWIARDAKTFITWYITDIVVNGAAVTATLLLAERFSGIGPWAKSQVLFLLGYAVLASGLLDPFCNYNVKYVSRRLGRGQLDHTLIQPQPIWMALLTEGFSPLSGTAALLPGLVLLVWATHALHLSVTPAWIAALLLNLLASAIIILAFSYLWGSLAFWAPRSAEEISSSALRTLDQLKSFPLDGLGLGLLGGLLTVLPVGFVAWYPCRALLGIEQSAYQLFTTPIAAAIISAAAILAFRGGLKQYARTGSQRYLSFGHRR